MANGNGNVRVSFWEQIREPQMMIALLIMFQFLLLIFLFGFGVLKMDVEAKQTILQAMIVAFTASWSYWLGSSSGSKMKDQKLMEGPPPVIQPISPPSDKAP